MKLDGIDPALILKEARKILRKELRDIRRMKFDLASDRDAYCEAKKKKGLVFIINNLTGNPCDVVLVK